MTCANRYKQIIVNPTGSHVDSEICMVTLKGSAYLFVSTNTN